uniref:MATH domain-containing protein n=1 Tax=Romanomermis culicivorax TaxID=13658 RepID=A0A915JAC0_ROMCU
MVVPRVSLENETMIGFFLQCNADSNIPCWSCHARATFKLKSQKEGVDDIEFGIEHIFCQQKNYSGYDFFSTLDMICDVDEGFIKDDTAIFQVEVCADAPQCL